MRLLIVLALLGAPIAHAGSVVLGPPPEPPASTPTPSNPLPPATIDCIVAALQAGLDPEVECDL